MSKPESEKKKSAWFFDPFMFVLSVTDLMVWTGVLYNCWRWFVVPALHAPSITFTTAIGFMLMLRVITRGNDLQIVMRPETRLDDAPAVAGSMMYGVVLLGAAKGVQLVAEWLP